MKRRKSIQYIEQRYEHLTSTGDCDCEVEPSVTELVLGEARIAAGVVPVDGIDLQRITFKLVSAHCSSLHYIYVHAW